MVLELIKEEKETFDRKKDEFLKNLKKVGRKYGVKLYLFGSRVRNVHLPSSDLDVLVVIPENSWKLRWKIYDENEENSK